MTLVDYESELVEALAKSAVFFATSDDKPGQLSLIEYVPKAMCAKLVTQANLLLGTLRDSGNGQKNSELKLEIYEFCSSVPLANLSPHQVNEERATRIRNSGVSVLLIVPPGPTFPSIGSAFQGTSYRELLRLESPVKPAMASQQPKPCKVAYHSSCHLRAAGVTKEPRAILAGLPGVEYVEMPP